MKVALCVSGDFRTTSNVILSACAQILPEDTVDVFAFLWAQPGVGQKEIHDWLKPQITSSIKLRRWTFETIRQMSDWQKFSAKLPPQSVGYLQELERTEYALQMVCQLKGEQERIDGADYDAVVRVESSINVTCAPQLEQFRSIVDDHIVIGHTNIMPWFPVYDFRLAMMSSRNMEVYSAIQTMHRRQYIMRFNTFDIHTAFMNHFHHARIKTCCVPVSYASC